jgi:hypothetical protein
VIGVIYSDETGQLRHSRWAIIGQVTDPAAMAEFLRAEGDHDGAGQALADGVGEWVVGFADNPEDADYDIWSTQPMPGVTYRREEQVTAGTALALQLNPGDRILRGGQKVTVERLGRPSAKDVEWLAVYTTGFAEPWKCPLFDVVARLDEAVAR